MFSIGLEDSSVNTQSLDSGGQSSSSDGIQKVFDNEYMISLQNVGVAYPRRIGMIRFERFWPLKNISFNVGKGETLGLIGRNGAGKSTLLRLMAGIISPDQGVIVKNCEKIVLLSLQAGFLPHLTGRENAIINGIILGLSYQEIKKKLDDIVEFSELEKFIDQPLKTYSTGMRARLGFSTAIQVSSDILLIDETFGVGDESFRKKSIKKMREIINSNRTIVFVSHMLSLVKDLCNRVIWIDNGSVMEDGNPEEAIKSYVKSRA